MLNPEYTSEERNSAIVAGEEHAVALPSLKYPAFYKSQAKS